MPKPSFCRAIPFVLAYSFVLAIPSVFAAGVAADFAEPGADYEILARHHGMMSGHHGPMGILKDMGILKEMELSDDQQARIQALMEQSRQLRLDHHARMLASVQALLSKPQFDAAAAEQIIDSRQAHRRQMQMSQMELHYDIYQLLTPLQQERFNQVQSQWMDKRGGMGRQGY